MNYSARAITAFIQAGDLIGAPIDAYWNSGGYNGSAIDGGFQIRMNLDKQHPLAQAHIRANPKYDSFLQTCTRRNSGWEVKVVLRQCGWLDQSRHIVAIAASLESVYDTNLDPGYDGETRVQLDFGQWRPDPSGGFQIEVQSLKNLRFQDESIKDANRKVITFCELPFPKGLRWGMGIRVVLRPEDIETPMACADAIRQLQVEVETRRVKLLEHLLKPEVMAKVTAGREKEIAKKVAKELKGTT